MTTTKAQTLDSWLKTHAEHQPDQPALHFDGNTRNYRQLADWVERIATVLAREHGMRRGDRFAFLGHNSDLEVGLLFAAAKLGLIMVPLNWRLAAAELNFIVRNCGARVLFHSDAFEDAAAAVLDSLDVHSLSSEELQRQVEVTSVDATLPAAELSDPYLIVYTSGTTGRPKGAVMTQNAVLWNAIISSHAHDFSTQDHVLNILPLFHVGGINIQMMPCFFVGGTVTLHPGFDPVATIDALEHAGITTMVSVPTVMRALLDQPNWDQLKLPRLRMINIGSTDVPVEILERVNSRGIPMVQVYGATETGPIAIYQRAAEASSTIGSIGRCGAHTQVRLVNEDGDDCATGEQGEIWIKGPNNFAYYWNDPEATAAAVVDGWFRTGDVARRDESGLYWFTDRLTHVIISGGENIYPAELERIINQLPGIVEAAVAGRKDDKWGEVPVVVAVVASDGPGREDILAACENAVARFKRPRDVVFVDALPRNALGKVLNDEVRKICKQSE